VGSQPIRTHIRATLEALDIAYLYQEEVNLGTIDLMESSVREDAEFFAPDDE
jgi:hypothetical protein